MMALVLSKRKSIICTNDCIVFWRIHACFGLKGLKHRFVLEIPGETWFPSVYCIYKCPDVTMHLVIFLSKCEFYSWGPFDNKPSLVHMMTWHWTGAKPLPAPMTAQFSDVSFGRKGLKHRLYWIYTVKYGPLSYFVNALTLSYIWLNFDTNLNSNPGIHLTLSHLWFT